jgi:hypothetical protein
LGPQVGRNLTAGAGTRIVQRVNARNSPDCVESVLTLSLFASVGAVATPAISRRSALA